MSHTGLELGTPGFQGCPILQSLWYSYMSILGGICAIWVQKEAMFAEINKRCWELPHEHGGHRPEQVDKYYVMAIVPRSKFRGRKAGMHFGAYICILRVYYIYIYM